MIPMKGPQLPDILAHLEGYKTVHAITLFALYHDKQSYTKQY